ncbi:MAG: zinc-ribbon domain-containing protein [Candidatus Thermoplasmatota archaeon]|nr:zinc-ribbon domain-containing protein [Candidatus Thermoplasmatota archaeon]
MVNCPKCGKTSPDDAAFCTSCGTSLRSDVGASLEQQAKQFAQNMEQTGKKIGEHMAQAAKQIHEKTQKEAERFEWRMDRFSRRAENWSAKAFGPFGPLVESFIFLIVFRLIIMAMEHTSEELSEVHLIAALLLGYILPFFVLSLLSNYTQYLSRKIFSIKIFSPLFYAVYFVIFCWFISRILYDASTQFLNADILTAAQSLENSLPTIFIVFLLIGYIVLVLNLPKDQGKKQ